MQILWILLLYMVQCVLAIGDWNIHVRYSASVADNFVPLGDIVMQRKFDGNYTANFHSSVNAAKWFSEVLEAAKNGWTYRVRADSGEGYVQGYNEPCLMLRANGTHHFRLSMHLNQQSLQSLALFPENLFSVGSDYWTCETDSFRKVDRILGSVVVDTMKELPLPDTISYIQKMEKERQARQHGAQQDNRSFIQKYWMYIAAAVIFMVISNAATAEQSGE